MIALCGAQTYAANNPSEASSKAKTSSYHNRSGWHLENEFDVGLAKLKYGGMFDFSEFAGPKLTAGYSLGYGSWFDLRLRVSGIRALADTNSSNTKSAFWNTDASLFFPICISTPAKLTLLPLIGWEFSCLYVNTFYERGIFADTISIRLNTQIRSSAPLVGLYLKLAPTDKFTLQGGFSLQFPSFKEKKKFNEVYTSVSAKARRHGIGAEFEMHYALSQMLALTSKFEYLYRSASGSYGPYSTTYQEQASCTLGAKIYY